MVGLSAVPLSPKQCWLCWIKTWMRSINTAPEGEWGREDASILVGVLYPKMIVLENMLQYLLLLVSLLNVIN